MIIPPWTISGVLPPYLGGSAADRALASPYRATILDVVRRFATTERRKEILRGLVRLRAALIGHGIAEGFQWLDGSFVERKHGGGEPGDIDVVTFHRRPNGIDDRGFDELMNANLDLFHPRRSKARYDCDAYYVDLSLEPESVVASATYWFNLFSHRRITSEWKGMVQVPLDSPAEDAEALALLTRSEVWGSW